MKVMIVDDSRAMRMIIKRTLRHAGFGNLQIIEAKDGHDALEKHQTHGASIIISDWHMPGLDGGSLLKTLRESGDNVPFGFVTTQSTAEMQQRARDAGASFYVIKPVTVEAFQDQLGEFFQ